MHIEDAYQRMNEWSTLAHGDRAFFLFGSRGCVHKLLHMPPLRGEVRLERFAEVGLGFTREAAPTRSIVTPHQDTDAKMPGEDRIDENRSAQHAEQRELT